MIPRFRLVLPHRISGLRALSSTASAAQTTVPEIFLPPVKFTESSRSLNLEVREKLGSKFARYMRNEGSFMITANMYELNLVS